MDWQIFARLENEGAKGLGSIGNSRNAILDRDVEFSICDSPLRADNVVGAPMSGH